MAIKGDEGWLTKRFIELSEVRLHVVEAGDGPLVLLLHGFPEFWYSWRYQIKPLVDAGYRVAVPDMRGYNTSSKPRGIRPYRIETLARDVSELIVALGADKAVVVGHDWGGAIGWVWAMRYPEQVSRLVIMNLPHPRRMMDGFLSLRQLRKSWYIFFFQLPFLPELIIRMKNWIGIRVRLARDPVTPRAFSGEDIQHYLDAAAQPGALTAAINYYRALRFEKMWDINGQLERIDVPVLILWGRHDRYLGDELAEPPSEWVSDCKVVLLDDASHWVQVDQPERVNQELLAFLSSHGDPSSAEVA